MNAAKLKYGISDWVRGKTVNDERFHGFVESVKYTHGTVKVNVTQSDHGEIIGKSVETLIHFVEKLPSGSLDEEGYLLNLIDCALSMRDKHWFHELSNQLKHFRESQYQIPS